jgi:hypothetical protein
MKIAVFFYCKETWRKIGVMKRFPTLIFGGTLLLAILLCGTNPTRMPPFILIVPFVLLFALLAGSAAHVLQKRRMSRTKSIRMGVFFAGLPISLLVLQSIGQLTPRDVITILALFAISYFYVLRANTIVE